MRRLSCVVIGLCVLGLSQAANWENWRGPNHNGSIDETGFPDKLDMDQTLCWSRPLPGQAFSTPIVYEGRVYLTSTVEKESQLLGICLDAATGDQLWSKPLAEETEKWPRNTMASPSPVAGTFGVVFFFGDGTLLNLTYDGQTVWSRNIVADYGPLSVKFGFSTSPLCYDGKLYLAILRRQTPYRDTDYTGSMDSYLLCVDAKTGKTLARVARPSDAEEESTNGYMTPIVAHINGKPQIILQGADYFTGHDPQTCRELWRYKYIDEAVNWARMVPSAVVGGNVLYCIYPRGKRTQAYDLEKLSVNADDALLWQYDVQGPDVSTPALYKGYLYQIDDRKTKKMTCFEAATGKVTWTGQLAKDGIYFSSITAADDKLYCINDKGMAYVISADPKAFRVLDTLEIDEGTIYSTIAAAGGKLYLRTAKTLYCFGNE